MEPFVGQIMLTAFRYAPQGWVFCDGAYLSINNYTLLYSVIGINFGGDGVNNFQVPDLKGVIPLGMDLSQTYYPLGFTGGSATVIPAARGALVNSGSTSLNFEVGELPQSNLPPFVGLNFIIATEGLFPAQQ